jgi:hypothetical protein
MKLRTAAGLLALIALTGGTLTGCGAGAPAASPAAPTRSAASPAAATATAAPAPAGDATADLAGFVAAVTDADRAVTLAAEAEDHTVRTRDGDERTELAVQAAWQATERARRSIPAGLDRSLLVPVLSVYGELDARWEAVHQLRTALISPFDDVDQEAVAFHRRLARATQLRADLARLRAATTAHAPVRAAAPDSLAGADLDVRIEFASNAAQCGRPQDFVAVAMAPLVRTRRAAATVTGTLGSRAFVVRWRQPAGWRLDPQLPSCGR